MRKLFISYRRDDSAGMAGRIYDRLQSHFGSDSVFMDVDSIPYGVDFRQHLIEAVAKCNVLLAVIAERWLTIEQGGKRRRDDPNDFVRIEIETALARGIPVVPVLIGRTPMPTEEELPEELRALAYRNAAQVDSGRDFHAHVDRLIRKVDDLWPVPLTPPPTTQQTTPSSKRSSTGKALVEPFFWLAQTWAGFASSGMELAYDVFAQQANALLLKVDRKKLPVGNHGIGAVPFLKKEITSKHGDIASEVFGLGYLVSLLPFSFRSQEQFRQMSATIEGVALRNFPSQVLIVVATFMQELPCEVPIFVEKVERLKVDLQAAIDVG